MIGLDADKTTNFSLSRYCTHRGPTSFTVIGITYGNNSLPLYLTGINIF